MSKNTQASVNLFTFTKEIKNGKLTFFVQGFDNLS